MRHDQRPLLKRPCRLRPREGPRAGVIGDRACAGRYGQGGRQGGLALAEHDVAEGFRGVGVEGGHPLTYRPIERNGTGTFHCAAAGRVPVIRGRILGAPLVSWALSDAERELEEVIRRARAEGPQMISVEGGDVAVMLSQSEFDRLVRNASVTPAREDEDRGEQKDPNK
ncbi:MAG TPA: type II toxin-antitoxin system Phd/YefM family antitoxin [Caulobacteraceae bacterium]